MSEQAFMQRAVALALEKMRANSGGPFGAVIVRNDTIIAEGWNEVTFSNDPTAHAEIVAIRRACTLLGAFNLPDCDIDTSCEPCPMCLGAIYWARLRRVYYANTRADASQIGFDDGFIYSEVARVPELRKIPHLRLVTAAGIKGTRALLLADGAHDNRGQHSEQRSTRVLSQPRILANRTGECGLVPAAE